MASPARNPLRARSSDADQASEHYQLHQCPKLCFGKLPLCLAQTANSSTIFHYLYIISSVMAYFGAYDGAADGRGHGRTRLQLGIHQSDSVMGFKAQSWILHQGQLRASNTSSATQTLPALPQGPSRSKPGAETSPSRAATIPGETSNGYATNSHNSSSASGGATGHDRNPGPTIATDVAAGSETPPSPPRTVRLHFLVPSFASQPGQQLVVVGSCERLGRWQPGKGLALQWGEGHRWSGEVVLEVQQAHGTEFKVLMVDSRTNTVMWEPGRNRVLQLVLCEWGHELSHIEAPPPGPAPSKGTTSLGAATTTTTATSSSPSSSAGAGSGLRVRVQVVVPLFVGGPGQRLVVVGSLPELGGWEVGRGVELSCSPGHIWRGEVELPLGTMMEVKLVVLGPGPGDQRWEAGPNRTLTLQVPPPEDILPPPPSSAQPPPHPSAPSAAVPRPPARGVAGHYVLLLHWGITGCSQPLYRPDLPVEVNGNAAAAAPPLPPPDGCGCDGDAAAGASLSDRQVLSLVHFTVPQFVTLPGQHLVLVGSVPAMGGWNPSSGVELKWGPGHCWSAELLLPVQQDVEAKVVYYDNGRYSWEPGPNRSLQLSRVLAGCSAVAEPLFTCYWGHTPTTPISERYLANARGGASVIVVRMLRPVVVVPRPYPRDLPPELQQLEGEVVMEVPEQQQQHTPTVTSEVVVLGEEANDRSPAGDHPLLQFLVFMMSTFMHDTNPQVEHDQVDEEVDKDVVDVAAVAAGPYFAQWEAARKALRAAKFRNTKLAWELAETRRQFQARLAELSQITEQSDLAAAGAAAPGPPGHDGNLSSSAGGAEGEARMLVPPAPALLDMGPQALSAAVSALVGRVAPLELQSLRELLRAVQAAEGELAARARQMGPVPSTAEKRELMDREMVVVEARDELRNRLARLVATGGPAVAAAVRRAAAADGGAAATTTTTAAAAAETAAAGSPSSRQVDVDAASSSSAAAAAAVSALRSAMEAAREQHRVEMAAAQQAGPAEVAHLEGQLEALRQQHTEAAEAAALATAVAADSNAAAEALIRDLRSAVQSADAGATAAEAAAAAARSGFRTREAELLRQLEELRRQLAEAVSERRGSGGDADAAKAAEDSVARLRAESYARHQAQQAAKRAASEAEARAEAAERHQRELEEMRESAQRQLEVLRLAMEAQRAADAAALASLEQAAAAREAELAAKLQEAHVQQEALKAAAATQRSETEAALGGLAARVAQREAELSELSCQLEATRGSVQAAREAGAALGRGIEDLAWELSAALTAAASTGEHRREREGAGGGVDAQAEAELRAEIEGLMSHAASLEHQLAEARQQYNTDLLAAEQLAVEAREAALAAARRDFESRCAAMRAAHEAELEAARRREEDLHAALQELSSQMEAVARERELALRQRLEGDLARAAAAYDQVSTALAEQQLAAAVAAAASEEGRQAAAAAADAARAAYEEMAARQQVMAEEQLRRELAALAASHSAEVAALQAQHAQQLAERAAAVEEVAEALGAEMAELRGELERRGEMYSALLADERQVAAAAAAAEERVSELEQRLALTEDRHRQELGELRVQLDKAAAASELLAARAPVEEEEPAKTAAAAAAAELVGAGMEASAAVALAAQVAESAAVLQQQLQLAEARQQQLAEAEAQQRALEVRLAEATGGLAEARHEYERQLAEAEAVLGEARRRFEARLEEQQLRVVEEVAARKRDLELQEAALQDEHVALAARFQSQLESALLSHKAREEELAGEHRRQVTEVEEEFRGRMKDLTSQLDAAQKQLQEAEEREKQALGELAALRQVTERKRREAAASEARRQSELEALRHNVQAQQLEDEQVCTAAEEMEPQEQWQRQQQTLEGLQAQVAALQRRLSEEEAAHSAKMAALAGSHMAALESRRAQHRREMQELRVAAAISMAQMEAAAEAHAAEMQEVGKVGGEALSELREELAQQLQDEHVAVAARFQSQLESALLSHKAREEELAGEHRRQVTEVEEEFRGRMKDLTSQLDAAQKQLQEAEEREKQGLESEEAALAHPLAESEARVAAVRAAIATWKAQVEELRGLMAEATSAHAAHTALISGRAAEALAELRATHSRELQASRTRGDGGGGKGVLCISVCMCTYAGIRQVAAEALAAVEARAEAAARAQAAEVGAVERAGGEVVSELKAQLWAAQRAADEARRAKDASLAVAAADREVGAAAVGELQARLDASLAAVSYLAWLLGAAQTGYSTELAKAESRAVELTRAHLVGLWTWTGVRLLAVLSRQLDEMRVALAEAEARAAAASEEVAALRSAEARAAVTAAAYAATAAESVAAQAAAVRQAEALRSLERQLQQKHAIEVDLLRKQITELRTHHAAQLAQRDAALQAGPHMADPQSGLAAAAEGDAVRGVEVRRAEDLRSLRRAHEAEMAELRGGYEVQLEERSRALHRALGLVAALQAQVQELQGRKDSSGAADIGDVDPSCGDKGPAAAEAEAAAAAPSTSESQPSTQPFVLMANNVVPSPGISAAGGTDTGVGGDAPGRVRGAGGNSVTASATSAAAAASAVAIVASDQGPNRSPSHGVLAGGGPGGDQVMATVGGPRAAAASTAPDSCTVAADAAAAEEAEAEVERLLQRLRRQELAAEAAPPPTGKAPVRKPVTGGGRAGGLFGGLMGLLGGLGIKPVLVEVAPPAATANGTREGDATATVSVSARQIPRSIPVDDEDDTIDNNINSGAADSSSDSSSSLAAALYREMRVGRTPRRTRADTQVRQAGDAPNPGGVNAGRREAGRAEDGSTVRGQGIRVRMWSGVKQEETIL
ncbi:hypothetical protein VOLCADRAFT_88626 [Volvox carteri f. nagariensis]|uniref:CBM20 domain-containing protein n=1 Tax=Volvox carteri f. nagariensis TaxID=3068 RepID=D8TPI1_VOLCA|nr:uncharacterized protein VOLCADRAFT_88626 [Volvox carteri f. nagariensis]EFJ50769.1 hypothetical protein VOLCADRAFT_88626 [Volvox carteri f. nagariensis]|eukprot:XP_002948362.1 hypothetical protein VOLCADRAFT_88626 [Volvox carteri f. nagariensis]